MPASFICAGDTHTATKVNDSQFDITVRDYTYIPKLAINLLSVIQLIANENRVIYQTSVCHIDNQMIALIAVAY